MKEYLRNPRKTEDMPKEDCYMILTPETVHIPGDEISRQWPGHGYGPSTEHYWNVRVYYNFTEFEKAVAEFATKGVKFVAYKCNPVSYKVNVSVNVEIK